MEGEDNIPLFITKSDKASIRGAFTIGVYGPCTNSLICRFIHICYLLIHLSDVLKACTYAFIYALLTYHKCVLFKEH